MREHCLHADTPVILSVRVGQEAPNPIRYREMWGSPAMNAEKTTVAVQLYLDALAADDDAEPIIRALLERAVRRLHLLCANLLRRKYHRLTLPPVNLQPEEMLDAVVERLLKAMQTVRPASVRQFFGLANQHMRWELNDLARRLDKRAMPLSWRTRWSPRRQPAIRSSVPMA